MRWIVSWHRTLFLVLVGGLLLCGLVPTGMGTSQAQGTSGKAFFDIEPIFYSYPNARPRPYFTYQSAPGSEFWDSITVKNVGTARGSVTLSAVDAFTSQSSGVAFTDPTQRQHDVGAWISLSRHSVTLDAGGHVDIAFRLHIPKKVRPGQHGGGILAVEPVEPFSAHRGSYTTVLQQRLERTVGVLVNVAGAITEKLDTTGIFYDTRSGYQRLLVALHNTGTQLLHPRGELQVRSTTGTWVRQVPLKLDTLLPQAAIEYPIYWQHHGLAPGPYDAKLSLQYEGQHVLTYATRFVVPIPQLQAHPHASQVITDLVTNNPSILQDLTVVDYLVGLPFLLLVLSALLFWSIKTYRWFLHRRKKSRDM